MRLHVGVVHGPPRTAGRAAVSELRGLDARIVLGGASFSYEGPVHSYVDAIGRPVPMQDKVPIHLGGSGPKRTLPLVARYADWWNCPVNDVDRLDELRPSIGNARISMQRVIALAP